MYRYTINPYQYTIDYYISIGYVSETDMDQDLLNYQQVTEGVYSWDMVTINRIYNDIGSSYTHSGISTGIIMGLQ